MLLLVATTTGYQTRAFDEAAARLGVELVLATDRCHALDDPWRDRAVPVRFHDVAGSVRALQESDRARRAAGVLAVGDRPAVIAAHAARALGLAWHAPAGAEAARNKLRTRERLRDAGLVTPRFRDVTDPADLAVVLNWLPVVVKPLVFSGSRGVIRADTAEELAAAVDRVRRLLARRDVRAMRDPDGRRLLVESYVPGEEYAVEALLSQGRLRVLAVFDKPDPLEGPFFEETIYVTPSRASPARVAAIEAAVERAVLALGLGHGPVHAECRVSAGHGSRVAGHDRAAGRAVASRSEEVCVLEIAARPIGGLCARALRFTDGDGEIAFEELLLRHALGEQIERWKPAASASGVMMVPIPAAGVFREAFGEAEARTVEGVTDVRITAKQDQLLLPLPEGATYLGFIFARADAPAEVERALRSAHARLRFRIDPPIAVAG